MRERFVDARTPRTRCRSSQMRTSTTCFSGLSQTVTSPATQCGLMLTLRMSITLLSYIGSTDNLPASNHTNKQKETQLPQRNSESAAHTEGPSSPLPLRPLWLHLCVWSKLKPATNVRQASVRKAHFKMNRAFKVIQGHPYWCRQAPRTVCCRNVQLMPTLFLKLTKIRQREHSKFVDFNDHTQV